MNDVDALHAPSVSKTAAIACRGLSSSASAEIASGAGLIVSCSVLETL
jgi:hypothetical protein